MVSVIVPIYNEERWLPEAIDSVLRQSYGTWELILVDDGSTDGSINICNSYAEADPRVKVIRQPNGGLSRARNAGLVMAAGEMVTFLDSDDFLPENYLEVMVTVMERSGADIVSSGMRRFRTVLDEERRGGKERDIEYRVYTPEEAVSQLLYQDGDIDTSACDKLYRRGLWENMSFTPGIRYEDLDIIHQIMGKASVIAFTDSTRYYYRKTPGSILNRVENYRSDVLRVTSDIENRLGTTTLRDAARARRLSANFNILGLIAANPGPLDAYEEECRKYIESYPLGKIITGRLRLKDRLGLIVYRIFGKRMFARLGRRIYK